MAIRSGSFSAIEFTVDAALLRELGERLVGKPHVALAELVKNSYDADASKCRLVFSKDSIQIIDNGNGMTFPEFKNFWMRIGTTHKQNQTESPRFHRPVTGSKGIGRLSVQFLGNQLEMWTSSRESTAQTLHAKVDWTETRKHKDLQHATADYRLEASLPLQFPGARHGTKLVIRGLSQSWDQQSIRELAQELWILQPPRQIVGSVDRSKRFTVVLEGVDEDALNAFKSQMEAALRNWIAQIDGHIANGRSGAQAVVKVKFRDGKEFSRNFALPLSKLNRAKFTVRIFNLSGRQEGGVTVSDARDYFKKYGGVHIYDDEFRLPFYGGEDQDWLGLERDHSHRLMVSQLIPEKLQVPGGMNDLPTLGRVFGMVHVSTSEERRKASQEDRDKGEYLNIQVTRDRLIDNKPFQDLVYLVRWAFDFYAHRSAELKQQRIAQLLEDAPPPSDTALLRIKTAIARVAPKLPKRDAEKLKDEFANFEETQRTDLETVSRERILLGALATAGMSAVALEHELGKEIAVLSEEVERLRDLAKGPLKEEISAVAKSLEDWIERASGTKLMFSPLMNREDREKTEKLNAKKVVQRVSFLMKPLLRKIEVNVEEIPNDLRLPPGTMAGWNAIFQNALLNSVNAMLDSNIRRIRCYGGVEKRSAYLVIEDTGVGVDVDKSEQLFKPFVRRLKISEQRQALGLGGVGLGLTIVRIVATSLGCDTEFIEPRRPFKSALELRWEIKLCR